MSTATAAPTEAEKQAALGHLQANVGQHAFFDKLSSYGMVPANEHQARQYLELGDRLYDLHLARELDQAEKRGSFLDYALATLDEVAPAPQAADFALKQAAASYAALDGVLAAAATLAA